MAVNSYLNPALNSFAGMDILNIPGLLPVDLHSSNPYPVPFAPSFRPGGGSMPSPAPAGPQSPTGSNAPGSNNPPPMSGLGPDVGIPNTPGSGPASDGIAGITGSASGVPDIYTPGFGQVGDAIDYNFLNGSYGANGSFYPGGSFAPSSGGGFNGGFDLGSAVNSFTANPNISGANLGQAGINAGGLISPIIPILAGALQGFNQIEPGETTGNSLTDILGTPGALQNGTAWLTNQINQLFGGSPMASSYIDPNMSGPGGFNGGSGGYIPASILGPLPDGSAYYSPDAVPNPIVDQTVDQIAQPQAPSGMGGAAYPDPMTLSDLYGLGGQAYDIGGAGAFNSIGLAPWMTADNGGGWGGAGGGVLWNGMPDNNGGWGQ